MTSQRLLYGCGIIVLVSLLNGSSVAEMSPGNAINNLYENLLQREYAGPISFPERVERKAQRSPSLRLRFGRSDPSSELMPMEEKRWFGDVDQKPIRSPSLRLRFGRADPAMKEREAMNWDQNEYQRISQEELISSIINSEKLRNLLDDLRALSENQMNSGEFQRDIRKQQTPLRLRWGRSAGNTPNSVHEQEEPQVVANQNADVPDAADKA